jgi:hypothetical protein
VVHLLNEDEGAVCSFVAVHRLPSTTQGPVSDKRADGPAVVRYITRDVGLNAVYEHADDHTAGTVPAIRPQEYRDIPC